uniref:L1 transposable element RRM domain-containing protein n=1 Tax=Anolis carolinensis TaxID=28377 RepID=A0A803TU01_ANOCA
MEEISFFGNDELKEQVEMINTRLGSMESKVQQYEGKFMEMQEETRKQKEEIANLKKHLESANQKLLNKIADQEDRSRRANIRLRTAGQDFQMSDNLKQNIVSWLQTLMEISPDDIEQSHWAYRGRKKPRDILIRFSREATKEKVYNQLRKIKDLALAGKKVWPLLDLSSETLDKRAQMKEITKVLEGKNQRYTWAFPATLIVYRDGKLYKATDLASGKTMLTLLRFCTEGGVVMTHGPCSPVPSAVETDEEENLSIRQLPE